MFQRGSIERLTSHGSQVTILQAQVLSVLFLYFSTTHQYVETKWKYIVPGNIVKLSNDEIIPADVLLLKSSDPNDICHIETANLDGETNLKQREVVRNFNQV